MKTFSCSALSWSLVDGVVELALHRPPTNELSATSWDELEKFVDALTSLEKEAGALIIYSRLKSSFGSGGDLHEMYGRLQVAGPGNRVDELRTAVERSHRVLNAIDSTPLMSIAAVHGVCFGAAFELALTCDLIIADKTARFCFPELRLGLIPGAGGIPRLKRDVKNAVVRDLLFTGRSINSEKAHTVGLVSHIVDVGEALHLARSTAGQVNKYDLATRIAAKRFIKPTPGDELRYEIDIFCELFSRPTVMDTLRKFVEAPGRLPYLP